MGYQRKTNGKIFVENVDSGYRLWCDICGKEQIIKIPDASDGEMGMPVEVFTKWLSVFGRLHKRCKKDETEQLHLGASSI